MAHPFERRLATVGQNPLHRQALEEVASGGANTTCDRASRHHVDCRGVVRTPQSLASLESEPKAWAEVGRGDVA
jgi:hypothetical protein